MLNNIRSAFCLFKDKNEFWVVKFNIPTPRDTFVPCAFPSGPRTGTPSFKTSVFLCICPVSLLLTGPACYLRYIAPVFETGVDPTIVHKVFCIQSWVVLCATWLILRLFLRCEAAKIQIFVSGDDFLSQTHPCVMVQAVSWAYFEEEEFTSSVLLRYADHKHVSCQEMFHSISCGLDLV